MIKLFELKNLPLVTLGAIAMSIARQIDAGASDQRTLLESVIRIIQVRMVQP